MKYYTTLHLFVYQDLLYNLNKIALTLRANNHNRAVAALTNKTFELNFLMLICHLINIRSNTFTGTSTTQVFVPTYT